MEIISIEQQMAIEGGFVISASTIAALVTLGISAVGIYKLFTSQKGKIKLPFVEFEWALNQGMFDHIAQTI